MADIFHEVDDELRKDKYEDALRKFGPWILAAVVAIVVAAGGYKFWEFQRAEAIGRAAQVYLDAQISYEEGDALSAAAQFETLAADQGRGGYAALSLMQRGAIALDEGDPAAAAGYFEQAAAATNDRLLSDLAELKALWARGDTLSFAEVQARARRLVQDDAPYRFSARETVAAAALREGRLDEAENLYLLLRDSFETPQGIAGRATEAMSVIEQRRALEAPAEDAAPADGAAAPADNEAPADTAPEEETAQGDDVDGDE